MPSLQFLANAHRHASIVAEPISEQFSRCKSEDFDGLKLSLAALADTEETAPWVYGFLSRHSDGSREILEDLFSKSLLLFVSNRYQELAAKVPEHMRAALGNAGFIAADQVERQQLVSLDWISSDTFQTMGENHLEWIDTETAKVRSDLAQREINFVKGLEPYSEILGIDSEQVRIRLQNTKYKFADFIDGALDMKEGQYLANDETILTVLGSGMEGEIALIHEMIHRVSGRALVLAGNKLKHFKLGLAFFEVEDSGKKIGSYKYTWLNEAVTRSILYKVSGCLQNAYSEETKLMEILLNSGKKPIAVEAFYHAYFEDFEFREGRHALPNWGALRKSIAENFSAGFLNRLNKLVVSRGIETAIDDWRSCLKS